MRKRAIVRANWLELHHRKRIEPSLYRERGNMVEEVKLGVLIFP